MNNQNQESILNFLSFDKNKKVDIDDYNNRKNIELKRQISKIKYDKLENLYTLLEQYKQNQNDKTILKLIKSDIELNLYNIKGTYRKFNANLSSINKYTDSILDYLKYNIQFDIYKISNKERNKITKNENDKYSILLLILLYILI